MNDIKEIYTDQILDPADAMRSELDRDQLFELADNIKVNGLINPITVRPVGDKYEVVAGHRRLSACKIAGLIKIHCVVRVLDDDKTFAVMAAENLERADVDPVDEAIFITKYIERTGMSVAEVAKSLRRSVSYVDTRLAVGEMPDYMQHYLKTGEMKLGVALALVQISEDNIRRVWVDMAVRDGVSVPQAEYWLHGWKVSQLPSAVPLDTPPDGYEPGAVRPILFECAITGEKYDVRDFSSVMIYNGNMPTFKAFVSAFRSLPPESESSPDAN